MQNFRSSILKYFKVETKHITIIVLVFQNWPVSGPLQFSFAFPVPVLLHLVLIFSASMAHRPSIPALLSVESLGFDEQFISFLNISRSASTRLQNLFTAGVLSASSAVSLLHLGTTASRCTHKDFSSILLHHQSLIRNCLRIKSSRWYGAKTPKYYCGQKDEQYLTRSLRFFHMI